LGHFSLVVEPIFVQSELLKNKNKNLRKTRDLLLPKLINGEIDVEKMDINIDFMEGKL
jgi:type I restriction enzyme S subunit